MSDRAPHHSTTYTHLGHSCGLLEFAFPDGGTTRLLLDPGNLTAPVIALGAVDAVLVTHAHPDHLEVEQIKTLRAQGAVRVYGPSGAIELLEDLDVVGEVVEPGETTIAGIRVKVRVAHHETIYPGVTLPDNFGYFIDGRIYVPGDSLDVPEEDVDLLLAPLGAPWMKLSDGIDYVRSVSPAKVVPVHDAGLAAPHRGLHRALLESFSAESTEVCPLDPATSVSL